MVEHVKLPEEKDSPVPAKSENSVVVDSQERRGSVVSVVKDSEQKEEVQQNHTPM